MDLLNFVTEKGIFHRGHLINPIIAALLAASVMEKQQVMTCKKVGMV